VFVEGKRESRSGFAVLQGVVGDWQGGNMHTTITCIRLYPGIGQFPRLPESHLLWRRGALGPLVYFIFFFSSDWFGTLRIAYCVLRGIRWIFWDGERCVGVGVGWVGLVLRFRGLAWDAVWSEGQRPECGQTLFLSNFICSTVIYYRWSFYLILELSCACRLCNTVSLATFWWRLWLRSMS
jgi:hypothetical protein